MINNALLLNEGTPRALKGEKLVFAPVQITALEEVY